MEDEDPWDVEPTTLERAARMEVCDLWQDLDDARRSAIGTDWSIRCGSIASRIVALSRFVGACPWQHVLVSVLLSGAYERVYQEAGIEYPPIDWERVREIAAKHQMV